MAPSKRSRPKNRPNTTAPLKDRQRAFRPLAGGVGKQKQSESVTAAPKQHIRHKLRDGPSLQMQAPVMLSLPDFPDYELLDSGFGQKLERYGPYRIIRPEGQAIWQPRLSDQAWDKADAVFTGAGEEEESGRWRFQNKLNTAEAEDAWPLVFQDDARFQARFTAFRHMGFFPEQAAHWAWFRNLIEQANRPIKVLNLFGYTGVASLIAAKAGATVTHVDASKKAIGWARENQSMSGLDDAPIRWICDDVGKFVAREERRGNVYDGIIMDPPKYGRGPKGEVWQYFEDLPDLMHTIRSIISDQPLFFILSSYAIRASFIASHELARDAFSGMGGLIESGELLIKESGSDRQISTSLFTRWSAGKKSDEH